MCVLDLLIFTCISIVDVLNFLCRAIVVFTQLGFIIALISGILINRREIVEFVRVCLADGIFVAIKNFGLKKISENITPGDVFGGFIRTFGVGGIGGGASTPKDVNLEGRWDLGHNVHMHPPKVPLLTYLNKLKDDNKNSTLDDDETQEISENVDPTEPISVTAETDKLSTNPAMLNVQENLAKLQQKYPNHLTNRSNKRQLRQTMGGEKIVSKMLADTANLLTSFAKIQPPILDTTRLKVGLNENFGITGNVESDALLDKFISNITGQLNPSGH